MVYKNYYTLIYFFIFFFTPGSFADKIGPKDEDANIARKETDTITLKCSYETSSENIYLYWYKQYPNSSFYCIKMQGCFAAAFATASALALPVEIRSLPHVCASYLHTAIALGSLYEGCEFHHLC
ncbi:hypothetical protein QTP86_025340 [Hemibagrus guttatus]|nr:hypothetical protein QTP86_025340 [Hemibagrus guttatus]